MKLFSKSIDPKRDHLTEFKTALSAAINAAEKAGILPRAIQEELESHAGDFRRAEQARIERRMYATGPLHVATPNGVKVVDHYAEQARAEEKRAARQLKADQADYQAALAQAAERERLTR